MYLEGQGCRYETRTPGRDDRPPVPGGRRMHSPSGRPCRKNGADDSSDHSSFLVRGWQRIAGTRRGWAAPSRNNGPDRNPGNHSDSRREYFSRGRPCLPGAGDPYPIPFGNRCTGHDGGFCNRRSTRFTTTIGRHTCSFTTTGHRNGLHASCAHAWNATHYRKPDRSVAFTREPDPDHDYDPATSCLVPSDNHSDTHPHLTFFRNAVLDLEPSRGPTPEDSRVSESVRVPSEYTLHIKCWCPRSRTRITRNGASVSGCY